MHSSRSPACRTVVRPVEVFLQYLDEIDDAWFFLAFLISKPRNRIYSILAAAFVVASCGSLV